MLFITEFRRESNPNIYRKMITGGISMIQNTVTDIIHKRRSTRSFQDRPVGPEQLETLLDAAIWAPSGGNSQTWLFTAIQNKEILLKLNELVREGFKVYTPDDDYPGKRDAKILSQKESYNFYFHAPVLIIASNRPNYENAMADCSLGLQNIFLTAESLGWAAVTSTSCTGCARPRHPGLSL
jgi:nitroreductase